MPDLLHHLEPHELTIIAAALLGVFVGLTWQQMKTVEYAEIEKSVEILDLLKSVA